jgi:hypothetical protein
MTKYFVLFFALVLYVNTTIAQEMNIKVTVQTLSSINPVANNPSFFKDMEKKISELINTTKWTSDEFADHEKIRGTFLITITEATQGTAFKAEATFQTERPVFSSSYTTPIINVIDKNLSFIYSDLQPLLKTNVTFYDNLSSIISFYMYYALGMDYDTFSNNGGTPYFTMAQEIITSLPSNFAFDEGWRNNGSGRVNRYWLLENLLSPKMRQFRQAFYEYHRLSLDKMYDESDRSRAVMLSAITSIGQANIEYPNTYLVQMFSDAKRDEIIEIFKLGDKGQKEKLKSIMKGMDVSRASKYDVLN